MKTNLEPVVDKIKKLFALANNNSNEAEASAAMAKAQELLAKYNLDLQMIQDSARATGAAVAEAKREQQQINRSAMYRWQQEFWRRLAESNYCFHWVTDAYAKTNKGANRRVRRHVILGSEANVASVVVMGEYLTETIERLLPYPNTERLSRAALSWREGCAERLIERIVAKMETMKSEGVTVNGVVSTALVVQDAVKREYAANYDARYGEGSWARHLKWEAEWETRSVERDAKYAAQAAAQEAERTKETPAQRRKREQQEARRNEREERRYQREAWREATRLDGAAYNAGARKAEDIGLDAQVKSGSPRSVLGGGQ